MRITASRRLSLCRCPCDVELGLTGALVAFGASDADAVTVTLIYRFLTIVPTLAVGLLAASTWKVGQRPATPTTA